MVQLLRHSSDWQGGDAVVVHVYADGTKGVCGFTTFLLNDPRASLDQIHTPSGTPIQFALKEALEVAKRLGIDCVLMNDPEELFSLPDEQAPDTSQLEQGGDDAGWMCDWLIIKAPSDEGLKLRNSPGARLSE